MLFLMAEGTCQVLVLGLTGAEHVQYAAVTCAAVLRRCIVGIRNNLRHVRLVAFLAIGDDHFSRVRFMALGALRDLAVDIVTGGTVKGRMLALELFELIVLLRMAGETRVRDLARECYIQRRVRVLVTTETALELVMGLPHMALIALRDRLFDRWRMTLMTACTTDILVLSTRGCNISRGCCMTFRTVIVCQRGLRHCRCDA